MATTQHIRHAVAAALLMAAGLLFPPPADAARDPCEAPPGTSAIEQYCESQPGAGGDRPTRGGSSGAVGPRTAKALRKAGAEGAAVGSLPAAAPGTRSERRRDDSDDPSGSAAAAAKSAADADSSGIPGFVWLLAAVALLMAGLAWMRSRRSASN